MKKIHIMLMILLMSTIFSMGNINHVRAANEEGQQTENNDEGGGFDDTYTGDDSYYANDSEGDSSEKTDYYRKNGSPFEEGTGNLIDKYKERTEPVIVDSVDVNIRISEDNKYLIEEKVNVYYNSQDNHKLTMSIPLNNFKKSDSDTVENVSVVSGIKNTSFIGKAKKDTYDIVIEDKNTGMTTVNYEIKYTYVSRGDDDSKYDVFAQNIINFPNVPVGNVTFSIEMPKEYEQEDLSFQDLDNNAINVPYSVDKLKIDGRYENEMPTGVIKIILTMDDGYFNSTSSSKGLRIALVLISITCWLSIFGGLALAITSYLKSGRNEKPDVILQRNPIKGLTGVDIVVALTGGATTEDLMLYFIHLANEGYIRIEDTTYRHQKNRSPIKGYRFIKEKEYDGDDEYMAEFMKIIFEKSNVVSPEFIQKSIYIRGKLNILRLRMQREGIGDLWTIDKNRSRLCANIGLMIPLLFSLLFSLQNLNLGFGVHSFSLLYGPMMAIIIYAAIKKVDGSMKKRNVVHGGVADAMTWIYVFGIIGLFLILTGILNANIFLGNAFTMTMTYFVECILIYCSCNMGKKTEKGMKITSQILGLRKFLLEADEVELKRAVLKDEQYAYNILPIAMGMGVATDGWLARMDGCYIDNPKWYTSGSDSEFRMTEFMKDWNQIKTVATVVTKEEIKNEKENK